MEAQLPALRQRLRFEVDQFHAGLDFKGTLVERNDLVHGRHVEHDAARQRHRLAVIAGSRTAHGQRNAALGAFARDLDHLGLALRDRDEIAEMLAELALEHGRVPVEIARFLLDEGGLVDRLDGRYRRFEGVPIGLVRNRRRGVFPLVFHGVQRVILPGLSSP
jgi:hypothetical protein